MNVPLSTLGPLSLLASFSIQAPAFTPVDLKCDGLQDPIAASPEPALTWRIDSQERGVFQSAYQIIVAATEEALRKDEGTLWDSGKSNMTRNPQIRYAGEALKSGQSCFWKVRSWDQDGKPSAWSKTASFKVAPTTPTDWQGAKWIDDGKPLLTKDEDFYLPDPAPLLRKEFSLGKAVVRARLHVAGIGYGISSINGKRLEDQPLDPPWTNFEKRILFRTHDVTSLLTKGDNCLGLTLGNGWFNPLRMWGGRNIRVELPTGRPRGIALLVVDHPDGTKSTIATDDTWKFTEGPTLRNSVFLGEERDGRLMIDGWDKPGFDASTWKKVGMPDASLEPLKPILDMPPVRNAGTIPAVSLKTPIPSVHIVDFGVNFTGLPVIKLNAPAGTQIQLRFGEILYPDGTLNPMTSVCGQIKRMRKNKRGEEVSMGGPGAPEIAWQKDLYITHGREGETYRPDFTFYAFRYMEITGLPEAPALEDIHAEDLHSELPSVGSFDSSNELLNQIQTITRRTFLNNVITVQSDCPHRERFGYGGDIAVTSEAYLMNYDMGGFYKKTIRDWDEGARPDGNFTDTVPFVGIQYCGVGWAMAHPLLLEQLYQHYGDKLLVAEQLPPAIRWFDLEASKRKDGLVVKGLGDHESLPKIAGPVLTTPMFIDTAHRMARLCDVVGKEADARRFRDYAEESAKAWAKEFVNEETGSIGGGSQSEQVLGLAWGSLPDKTQDKVLANLVSILPDEDKKPALKTGIFGTRFLMESLSSRGHHDQAYQLATRKTYPSWAWMLDNGATSLWETWKQSDNTFSHNHPMFGSVSAWFFRHLGGIRVASDAVGADRLVIHPKPSLGSVSCYHRTIRGSVETKVSFDGKAFACNITIPPDTTAIVILPGGNLLESRKRLSQGNGIELASSTDENILTVGSGTYQFTVTP